MIDILILMINHVFVSVDVLKISFSSVYITTYQDKKRQDFDP